MANAVKKRSKLQARASVGIQSVEVGLALLKELANAAGPVPLGTLAERAGMPRSKAHKYLASLVRAGIVIQPAPSGPYDLGPYAIDLGLAAMRRLDVIAMGQETLDGLRDRLGLTGSLAVWANRGPTIVRWAETPDISTPTVKLGTVFPVLTSTLGLVFAAYLDRRFTEPLIRAELDETGGVAPRGWPYRLSDVDALLKRVRRQGTFAADSVVAPGVASIAAPVFQHGNVLAAVIAVAGVAGRFDLSLNSRPALELAAACRTLSKRLGAEGPSEGPKQLP
jgi:DNA-binding IclR family transcriptional regulator